MVELKDDLLTVPEAAGILKVRPYTIYRWIAQGRLPAVRYSRRVLRVRRRELEEMGQRLPTPAADTGAPPKGSKEALLPFVGSITKEDADELLRVIMEAREASLSDPH